MLPPRSVWPHHEHRERTRRSALGPIPTAMHDLLRPTALLLPSLLLASCSITVEATSDPMGEEALELHEEHDGHHEGHHDGHHEGDRDGHGEGAHEEGSDRAAAKRESQRPELELAVELARRDLQIAEYEASMALDAAGWAVEAADAKLAVATERLERFGALERDHQEEESQMGVDRAEDRLVREQQDLQGILDIYAEETEARSRDEIIRRHRQSVMFAERGLEMAERAHALKVEHELPARHRELERAVREADQALDAAHDRRSKQELVNQRDLLRKRGALEDAERKLDELEREADA